MDNCNRTNRGVSDVLGFVLIFGLILTSVSLVYVVGFDSLNASQEQEELRNVERAYDILADNIRDVTQRDAPVRSTQVRLGTSRLTSGNEVTMEVQIYNRNTKTTVDTLSVDINPIEYVTQSGGSVRYESGAIIRSAPGGETFIKEPPITFNGDKEVLIPLIYTRPADGISGVSGGIIDIRTEHTYSNAYSYTDDTYDMMFTIEADRTGLWEQYCRDNFDDVPTSGDGQVTCTLEDMDAIHIQYTSIDVRYDT